MIKAPLWQGPSSPAGPPRAAPGGSGRRALPGGSRPTGRTATASGAQPVPRVLELAASKAADSPGFDHRSGTGNPTVTTLEKKIAGLESGYGAACFSTGMAATISVIAGT